MCGDDVRCRQARAKERRDQIPIFEWGFGERRNALACGELPDIRITHEA
jgi:hypothetical protein